LPTLGPELPAWIRCDRRGLGRADESAASISSPIDQTTGDASCDSRRRAERFVRPADIVMCVKRDGRHVMLMRAAVVARNDCCDEEPHAVGCATAAAETCHRLHELANPWVMGRRIAANR